MARKQVLGRITVRQHEVLGLMARGYSNSRIAQDLSVTVKAVDRHISSIYNHLNLHSSADYHQRVAAVIYYIFNKGAMDSHPKFGMAFERPDVNHETFSTQWLQ